RLPHVCPLFPYTTLFRSIAEQRAVGDVDDEGAAQDVGAARRAIAGDHLGRAEILAGCFRLAHDRREIDAVAQSEIQSLRADRGRSEEHTSELQSRENLVC